MDVNASKWLESGFVRFSAKTPVESTVVKHLCEKGEDQIIEDDIVNFFKLLLMRSGQWVETKVNLWEVVPANYDFTQTLWDFAHPLQPDIDILSGPVRKRERGTPLTGMEVKLLRTEKRGKAVIPKTRDGRGFYAGLEEALTLYDFGLDYVTLVQFFIPRLSLWSQEQNMLAPYRDLLIQYDEWRGTYAGILRAIIKKYHLPLGYFCCDIVVTKDAVFYRVPNEEQNNIEGDMVPLSITAWRLRQALVKKFEIKESVYKFDFAPKAEKIPRPRWNHVLLADRETPKTVTVNFQSDKSKSTINITVEIEEPLTKEEFERLVKETTEVATIATVVGWPVPTKLLFRRQHGILTPLGQFGPK
jgi:hypothetical protein